MAFMAMVWAGLAGSFLAPMNVASQAPAASAENAVPLSQVKTLPRSIGGMVSDRDYPSAALRREAQGDTRARLLITSTGLVKSCRIAQSSGHEDLDRRVCDLAVSRMRFSPALDVAGRPVAVEAILPVVWKIGDAAAPTEPSAQ
jgi:TonB family protein